MLHSSKEYSRQIVNYLHKIIPEKSTELSINYVNKATEL